MAQITNCLKLISRMPESDQDALVSRLDELQALGVPAQRAQVQAAIDLMARLEREANPQGIQRSAARDVTETPEFKAWSGGAPVVPLGAKHEYRSGQPVVVEALHGTTNADLTEFKRERANMGSDMGAGFYASNSPDDVATNYANNNGADLTARIELQAERIADEIDSNDDVAIKLISEYLKHAGIDAVVDEDSLYEMRDEYTGLAADYASRRQLTQESPNTLKLYVSFKNPAVLGGSGETYFDYSEEHNEETDEYSEPTGLLIDFVNALDEVGDGLDISMRDLENTRAKIFDAAEGEGLKFGDLVRIVKDGMVDTYSEDGNTSGSAEVLRQALDGMGFDGVIDTTVSTKFKGMKGMNKGTTHFIAFDPTQLKSATGNRGAFDPANPDITRSASRLPAGVEIIEVDDGFDAMKDGKRIGRLRDNLPRGAAEQLDENASVDIVKVENEFKGQGVGAALYDAFHEKHGGRIAPSGKTSPEAWALWKRKFPEKVDAFVEAEAGRIRDGADPMMVVRNISDPEVARRVSEAAGDVVIRSAARIPGRRMPSWGNIDQWEAAYGRWKKIEKSIKSDHPSINLDLGIGSSASSSAIGLVMLNKIESSAAGSGAGTAAMRDIVEHADREGVRLQLTVADHPENPTSAEQLRKWYSQFGFRHSGEYSMQRMPGAQITRSVARPEFFSQLERAVAAVPDRLATMSAPQWKLWLDANASKLGVKKDEIEWSGIKDYLTLRGKDKVTRDELVAYLADNGVRVQETMLGGDAAEKITLIRERTRRDAWGEVVVYRSSDGAFVVENGIGGQSWSVQDADSYDSDYSEDDGSYAGSFSSREAVESFINGQTQAADPDYSGVGSNPATKYGQYTVPGGENYREVLITLPPIGQVKYTKENVVAIDDADDPNRSRYFWRFKVPGNELQISRQVYRTQEEAKAYILSEKQPEPPADKNYKSSHFDQPNIIAHLRVDDRTDAEGNKVLFINEIQSDWGQDGKKKGFAGESELTQADYSKAMATLRSIVDENDNLGFDSTAQAIGALASHADWKDRWDVGGQENEAAVAEALRVRDQLGKQKAGALVPKAPFVTDTKAWASLALKRAIMMAVEGGYDRVALITGEQAAGLYSLDKQISKVEYLPETNTLRAFDQNGRSVYDQETAPDKIEDVIGKEVAAKLLDSEPYTSGSGKKVHRLDGVDLKVPAAGMRKFYDELIPQVARDVLKKLGGGRMEMVSIGESNDGKFVILKPDGTFHSGISGVALFPSRASAQAAANKLNRSQGSGHKPAPAPMQGGEQPGFDITPAMREKVATGVPLFSRRRGWDAFPDAIIATPPSTQSSDPSYAAAKGGDMKAALELVDRVMPDDIERRVRATIGDARPIVAAVHAEEAAGRNKIPLATAFVLGERLGLQVDEKLVQASRAKRTGSDGMARLGVQPEFAGEVERGADYLLVDDTLAQGGTLAQLKTHIEDNGGRVVGVFALSGKQYSAKISLDNATLNDVRAKYGSIEDWWKGELGYGFEGLTQSEARYMLNSRLSPEALRDRVAAARQAAGAGDGEEVAGRAVDQGVARSLPRVPGLNAGPVESTTGDYGREYTPQQLAMFKNTGRTTQKPSLVERLKEARKDLGKKMAQGIVDQFRPLRDLGGNAYTLARLSKGAAGAFEALLGHGKLKIVDGAYDADTSGGFIDTVGKPLGREIEDFMWWVAANRADSLSLQDRENLFTDDDIAAGKSLADGDLEFDYLLQSGATTRDRKAAYEDSLKKFNAFGKNVLDIAEESGLIDGESRKLWESEFYVPFYRVSEEDGSFIGAKIKGGLARQRAFHELKGGSQKLNSDLLANTMRNWAHLIDASAKNRAAKATLESAQNVGIALEADAETVRQLGKSMGGKGGTVWFMDGGQQRHFLVGDPYVLEAINSLEYAGLRGPLMDALSTMKHWLTVGVTASPAFKIRNLIRDSIQAISLSGLSYNPVTNLVEGYKATDRASQDYVSTLASGGLIRFGSMLEDSASERVRRLVKKGVDGNTILDSESKVQAFYGKYLEPAIEAYQEIGNRGEEINRASLYKQLRAKGVSHAEASLMARDLMDFSMQGTWTSIRFLTQVVPFMNARLQGMYKLGRGAMEDPRRFALVTGAVALMSISLLAAYGDDDDWKKREDWDRDGFWWFKFGGTAFRIPKPFEIGAIGSLAERGVELFTNDEFTAKRFGSRVLHLLGDNLAMNPIPQAVKPMLDIYANKDSFSGRPIESMGMERLQSEYRYNVHTSMIARGASSALNAATRTVGAEALSPVQIDSLIRGYFGWLGTFVVAGADMAVRPLTDEPTRPQADYLKVVSQGFLKTLPEPGSKYVSAMYDQAKVIEQAYATHRQMVKEGKVDEAREFAAENKDLLERYRRIEGVKEAQSKINKRVREIELSDMDPARKAEEIQKLRDQSDKIARKVY